MEATEFFILGLRAVHALAAVVWLGGGLYYLIALRPGVADDATRAVAAGAQRRFSEWSGAAVVAMLATGVILAFDRLAEGHGWAYYLTLGVKVGAALTAFLMTLLVRRGRSTPGWVRAQDILMLGAVAYVLGVALAQVWD